MSEGDRKSKRGSHQLFLGVDGGGTKTTIALMNSNKKILAEAAGGPGNPLRVGVENAVSNILEAVDKACDEGDLSRGDIFAAVLGLAGARRIDMRERVKESFVERYRIRRTLVIATRTTVTTIGPSLKFST